MKKNLFNCLGIALFCFSVNSNAQATDGTLTMTFSQAVPTTPAVPEIAADGSPANIMAVWIEDASGKFIKTKYRFAGSQKDHLPTWMIKSGGVAPTGTAKGNCLQVACNVTDATTGATLSSSTKPTAYGSKTVTWDGKNVVGTTNGTIVADGSYKVWIESSWWDNGNNNHQTLDSFTFTKGTSAFTASPTNTTYFSNIKLTWTPSNLANEQFSNNPVATIYPNPSNNGVFKLDFNNEVTSLKVVNLLGQTIYNEKVTGGIIATSKSVDLSKFANGVYVISVSNDKGTSSYEVILNK
jgi:hypothetical protein